MTEEQKSRVDVVHETASESLQLAQCHEEIVRLTSTNTELLRKLRGCQTLGDLLQEAKNENKLLNEDKINLRRQLHRSVSQSQVENAANTDQSEGNLEKADTSKSAHQASTFEPTNNLSANSMEKTNLKPTNTFDNLELDSDRFELVPEFEKIDLPQYLAIDSMSEISSGPDPNYMLPSISSVISLSDISSADASSKLIDVQPMDEMVKLENLDDEPAITSQHQRMLDEIAKTEDDAKKYKKLMYTFADENRKLKTSTMIEQQQAKDQAIDLREENRRLLRLVETFEHSRDNATTGSTSQSLSSQTEVIDRLIIEKPVHRRPRSDDLENELFQSGAVVEGNSKYQNTATVELRALHRQNRELKDANHSWNIRWKELHQQWNTKVTNMKDQVNSYKQELSVLKGKLQHQKENTKITEENLKSHLHEEQEAKSEAVSNVNQLTTQNRKLQKDLGEQECHIESINRDKHNLEAELEIIKARHHIGIQEEQFAADVTYADLQTENLVLKQQLQVFEEDFEKERQDRAAAQSTRADIQTNYDKVKHDKDSLTRKTRTLEQRLKTHEATLQQMIQRNESLQAEIGILQQQLRITQEAGTRRELFHQNQMMEHAIHPQNCPNNTSRYQVLPNQAVPCNHIGGAGYFPHEQQNINVRPPVNPSGQQLAVNWTCQECTYTNIQMRTVCEMCGRIRREHPTAPISHSLTHEPVLMSRDMVPRAHWGEDVPDENADLVVDSKPT